MESAQRTICFLITSLEFGGAENQLFSTSIVLKQRGWDVHVISMCPARAYLPEFHNANIPVYSLNMRRKIPDPRALVRFFKLIKKIRPYLVHSHMVHANLFARISRIFCTYKGLICTAHSIYEGMKWREIAYRFTDPLCNLTTNVCKAGVDRAIARKIVPKSKIKHVPNGIVVTKFGEDQKARQRIRTEMRLGSNFIFLAVGRFEEPKDYPNMLRAFSLVIKSIQDVILLIAGDGILRKRMESLSSYLGLSKNVRFLGIRNDIASLMNAADGYVMASAWEGLPIVLLEAASVGLPIVATDVGGNNEVVSNGINGYLVPPNNEVSLADAMRKLICTDKATRKKMGRIANYIIAKNYEIEKVVDIWEGIYSKLC